jgi:hypothetical protein
MSKKQYSLEQIEELQIHKHVKSCSEKYITFTNEFKIFCIEQDNLWVYNREIFTLGDFPEYIVESKVPEICLKRWRSIVRKSWEFWLIWKKKWRPKNERIDIAKMNKDEYIKYLEAKLALSEALGQWEAGKYP